MTLWCCSVAVDDEVMLVGKVCARGWCLGGTCGAAVTAEVCVSGIASEWERNPVCVHGGSCGVAESTLAVAALSRLQIQQQLAMATT